MKKKIIIGLFSVLILVTIIIINVAAADSYNYDMDPANGVDLFEGCSAALIRMAGGFVIFYELDLFYSVYYFFVKPKTVALSILHIVSNLTLLSVVFTDAIAHFLYKYVSKVFREEIIVLFALLLIYFVSRIVCAALSLIQFSSGTEKTP